MAVVLLHPPLGLRNEDPTTGVSTEPYSIGTPESSRHSACGVITPASKWRMYQLGQERGFRGLAATINEQPMSNFLAGVILQQHYEHSELRWVQTRGGERCQQLALSLVQQLQHLAPIVSPVVQRGLERERLQYLGCRTSRLGAQYVGAQQPAIQFRVCHVREPVLRCASPNCHRSRVCELLAANHQRGAGTPRVRAGAGTDARDVEVGKRDHFTRLRRLCPATPEATEPKALHSQNGKMNPKCCECDCSPGHNDFSSHFCQDEIRLLKCL